MLDHCTILVSYDYFAALGLYANCTNISMSLYWTNISSPNRMNYSFPVLNIELVLFLHKYGLLYFNLKPWHGFAFIFGTNDLFEIIAGCIFGALFFI
jgi:hypothetical protein